jgi:hypothetical protein
LLLDDSTDEESGALPEEDLAEDESADEEDLSLEEDDPLFTLELDFAFSEEEEPFLREAPHSLSGIHFPE